MTLDELETLLADVLEHEDYIRAIAIRDEIKTRRRNKITFRSAFILSHFNDSFQMVVFPKNKPRTEYPRKRSDGFHDPKRSSTPSASGMPWN